MITERLRENRAGLCLKAEEIGRAMLLRVPVLHVCLKPFYLHTKRWRGVCYGKCNCTIHRRRTFPMLNLKDSDGNYMQDERGNDAAVLE